MLLDSAPPARKIAAMAGDSLTVAERQQRHDQVVMLRARGLTWPQIAEATGLSRNQCMLVMKQFRESEPTLRTQDPLEVIDEMLIGYQADLAELATISNTTKNDSVRVGAINSRMAARDRIVGLLQATGVLPHDLGKLKVEIDVRYIAQRVFVIFDKYKVPEEAQEEILALMRGEDDPDVIEGSATAA